MSAECVVDTDKLDRLTLTESKAAMVLQHATHLRREPKVIADSVLAEQCGMSRGSAGRAKGSLARRGLASPGLVPWRCKGGFITAYSELAHPAQGVEIPFEFVRELLPKIRTKAALRIALAMLRGMDGGKHGNVFTTGELLALTGMDKRKLHPALKSEIFERVGHGRYRLSESRIASEFSKRGK